ncbi:MAG: hypothetical protein ACOYI8_11085 [Christensenellales bacterium]|jgi:hypothetical protein
MANSKYINFKKYGVRFDLDRDCFSIYYDGMGEIVRDAKVTEMLSKRGPQPWPDGFDKPAFMGVSEYFDKMEMTVSYSGKKVCRQDVSITFTVSDNGVHTFIGGEGSACTKIEGTLNWGKHCQRETMAVSLNSSKPTLRSAYGPAAGAGDNALFDRDTDSALTMETSGRLRIRYDWEKDAYTFSFNTMGWDFARGLLFKVEKDVYERKFHYEYKKVNPNSTFKTPPVGWMTWYSVQFDAGEKTVLENTKWQEEHLKKYGADTIWVDWEWYHPDFSSQAPEGVDMFHPNPKAYPRGLKYVADKIKESGFIPALWIGPTCDGGKNEMLEKYPESLMIHKPMWCGQYFFDPTHPDYINEILPKMVKQAPDWGYEAIKWDALPATTGLCDECRDTRYDPEMSTREAMKAIFQKAREVLGKDYYMLYCLASNKRNMDLACTVFDAARIGGDIFRWSEFITECVDKVCHYYALHTVICNNDPDNVVIREKFNSYDQAVTRAAIVSLLGLPFTFGDNLVELPEERVEILRRSIPPVPAHPMDIRESRSDHMTQIVNLAIERSDMRYNVADVINLKDEASHVHITLAGDLDLDTDGKSFYVYDYWNKEFIGEVKDGFAVELRAHQSRIFAIHEVEDKPQLISTSRHISQGVLDVLSIKYDAENNMLVGKSKVIGGEPYEVIVCAPNDMRIFGESDKTSTNEHSHISENAWRLVYHPEQDGEFDWSVGFTPKTKSQ